MNALRKQAIGEDVTKIRVLIVEDSEVDRTLLERELKKSGLSYAMESVEKRTEFIQKVTEFDPDMILSDFSLPEFGALEVLALLKTHSLKIPVIIVTGTLSDEMAVDCLKQGAVDYVIKDKIIRLPLAIRRVLELERSRKEKEEAEQRLQQSEKQLKVITDILPASLGYISTDFKFQFCNKINRDWFKGEIIGKHVQEILGEEIFKNIQFKMPELLAGKQVHFENVLSSEHAPHFVNVTLVPNTEAGTLNGFVCLITDVTEQKSYEDELKNAKEEAIGANSAKSQFLANMSHEMRTPLNVIMGLSELLLMDYSNPEERVVWIEKIKKNSEDLKKLIDEILDLSKIEAGKLQIQLDRFPINNTIADVKSTLLPLAQEKNLDLCFELDGPIPKFVHSDSEKLRHILLNLMGNAIKFSSEGPITLQLKLQNDNDQSRLIFLIKDHGPGMSADQAKHLFEPFTQVDNSMTRKFGGTGLGLTLARKFARALGGDVCLVDSVPGKGSTFSVTIDPGWVADSQKITSLETLFLIDNQGPKTSEQAVNLKGLKILLVEDSPENQFLVCHFLKTEGVNVEVASDGQEGLQKALSENYDIVLMDVQMPVLDGYNATLRLRQSGFKEPIIAFTAHAFQAERDRCIKAGFSDFLTKPIKKADLVSCLFKARH